MVLDRFRRRDAADPVADVAQFWAWWPTVKEHIDAVITSKAPFDLVDELSARVSAVHPGLEWELTPGRTSRHALVVSAAGNAELRYLAQRWLLAAPPPDEAWEYADARQPSWQSGVVMTMAEVRLALDEVTVAAEDSGRHRLDVQVHHPLMAQLPKSAQTTLAFLALDWLLGEDAVEQWIGSVDVAVEPPDGAFPASELPARVDELAADGEESWSLLEGGTPGRPRLALVRMPQPRFDDLQRIDHVEVTAPYRAADRRGLPSDASLTALRDLEDAAVELAEPLAVLVGHETSAGKRTLHLYSRDGDATARQLETIVRGWGEGKATLRVIRDPGWSKVGHLH